MHKAINQIVDQLNGILLGKDRQVRLALCSLFAGGHLLIEDIPGMGKTTLAHALAHMRQWKNGRCRLKAKPDPFPNRFL